MILKTNRDSYHKMLPQKSVFLSAGHRRNWECCL